MAGMLVVLGDLLLMEIPSDPIPQTSVINTTIQAFREREKLLNIFANFRAKYLHVKLLSVFKKKFCFQKYIFLDLMFNGI